MSSSAAQRRGVPASGRPHGDSRARQRRGRGAVPPYEQAGFEASVDITTAVEGGPLPDGLWDISLAIGAQGISREVRIGSKRDGGVSGAPATHIVDGGGEARAVTLYTTAPHDNFTLDIGERKHEVLPQLSLRSVRWAPGSSTELEWAGRCTLAAFPDDALAVHLEDGRGGTAAFPARTALQFGGDFVVRVPVTELPAGLWTGQLRLGAWSLNLPPIPATLAPAKWRRRGLLTSLRDPDHWPRGHPRPFPRAQVPGPPWTRHEVRLT
jgi:CDP-glycerol glycerophosphotransferase